MGGRGASSMGGVKPISGSQYESFKNYSNNKKFEMDGYVNAKTFHEALKLLEKQAEHITGQKGIVTDRALGGENWRYISNLAKKHPRETRGEQDYDLTFKGGEFRSFWRDNNDGRYHRMHIENVDEGRFYVDFGTSKKY